MYSAHNSTAYAAQLTQQYRAVAAAGRGAGTAAAPQDAIITCTYAHTAHDQPICMHMQHSIAHAHAAQHNIYASLESRPRAHSEQRLQIGMYRTTAVQHAYVQQHNVNSTAARQHCAIASSKVAQLHHSTPCTAAAQQHSSALQRRTAVVQLQHCRAAEFEFANSRTAPQQLHMHAQR